MDATTLMSRDAEKIRQDLVKQGAEVTVIAAVQQAGNDGIGTVVEYTIQAEWPSGKLWLINEIGGSVNSRVEEQAILRTELKARKKKIEELKEKFQPRTDPSPANPEDSPNG